MVFSNSFMRASESQLDDAMTPKINTIQRESTVSSSCDFDPSSDQKYCAISRPPKLVKYFVPCLPNVSTQSILSYVVVKSRNFWSLQAVVGSMKSSYTMSYPHIFLHSNIFVWGASMLWLPNTDFSGPNEQLGASVRMIFQTGAAQIEHSHP